MLADSLTKVGADPAYLLSCMSSGRYQIVRDVALEKAVAKRSKDVAARVLLEEEESKAGQDDALDRVPSEAAGVGGVEKSRSR